MSLSIDQALALAVLNGDRTAALALADRVKETFDGPADVVAAVSGAGTRGPFPTGSDVYRWPEFRALCDRLGVAWSLGTTEMTIHIPIEGPVRVSQQYLPAGRRDA